jgi:hypothetical protein
MPPYGPPHGEPLHLDDHGDQYIPCTREISIGRNVVYRPLRRWSAGTYAGEGIGSIQGDRSGCVHVESGRRLCSPPNVVTHRRYWNTRAPDIGVSAFLSYPHGMGAVDDYFWEIYGGGEPEDPHDRNPEDNDILRFMGPSAESDMEARILLRLADPLLIEIAHQSLEGTP